MIFPILPIFLTTILGVPVAIVGLIEGIAESASSLLKLLSGWFSDKFGKKKPLVIAGYSLSAFTKPLLAVASNWTHVLGVRFFDRVGKGIRTSPRDSLIAASVKEKKRGGGFGLHRALDTLGAIVGTLISFYILQRFLTSVHTFRIIFFISLVPGLIALLILIFKVKEVKTKTKKIEVGLNHSTLLKRFLFVITLFNLANFSYAFFILRAKDIGMVIALIPLVYLLYNLVYALFSIPAGKLSDKIGRKNVLSAGLLLFGLTSLGFAFFANTATIWLLFALYGLFMAATDGVSRAYVSDLSPAGKRGSALGLYHMIVGITVLPANLIGGFLWDKISVQAPFIFAALLAVVSALLLLVLVRKR
jgi:MFS family permease